MKPTPYPPTTDAPFLTQDPETHRQYVYQWGTCPECERETLLYVRVSLRTWACGNCVAPNGRAYP